MYSFLKKIYVSILGLLMVLSSTSFIIEKKCECCTKVLHKSIPIKNLTDSQNILLKKKKNNCDCNSLIIKQKTKKDFLYIEAYSLSKTSKIFFCISSVFPDLNKNLYGFYLDNEQLLYAHFSPPDLKQKTYILNEQFLI